jgi:Capsule assembly protein Wzi
LKNQKGKQKKMRLHARSMATSLLRFAGTSFLSALLVVALSAAAVAHAGSVYVPVDSWTYAAAERLAILTDTRVEVLGMRPWTRAQFAHFLERAREMPHDAEADELQSGLEREFAPELNSQVEKLALESVYTRSTQIAGTPLRDSYHFGQTFSDDFGRPYGQGFNNIEGASGYAQDRAGLLYVRGEYQHGASLRAPWAAAIAILGGPDRVPADQFLTQGGGSVDNPRLLDAYTGVSFWRWTGTLGKQSMWWGPATGGAMLESNNAEPIWMARLTNDVPYTIPILGKMRVDFFYGKLQGHKAVPNAWIHGEKVSLQPFKSFEIGFTRTTVWLGNGFPLSFGRLMRTYFSVGDNPSSDLPQNKPGDRRGGLDFSWKLPKIPVTLYSDSFCDDDPSPLASPHRSAFHPGLYIARLPGPLAKVDLRMEGSFTNSFDRSEPDGFNYWNSDYRDGYTNKGLLIGDTMGGRAGVSWQAWSTYWLSARDKVQVSYRHRYISPEFLRGGGTQGDIQATTNFVLKRNVELNLGVQSERVVIPLLTRTLAPRYNTSGWAGVTYWPEHKSAMAP